MTLTKLAQITPDRILHRYQKLFHFRLFQEQSLLSQHARRTNWRFEGAKKSTSKGAKSSGGIYASLLYMITFFQAPDLVHLWQSLLKYQSNFYSSALLRRPPHQEEDAYAHQQRIFTCLKCYQSFGSMDKLTLHMSATGHYEQSVKRSL